MAPESGERRTAEVGEAVSKPFPISTSWPLPSCSRWSEKWKAAPNLESNCHHIIVITYMAISFFMHKALGKDDGSQGLNGSQEG